MIRFALKCSREHQFESWFASAEAFDKLQAAGMVACAVCGDSSVSKSIMAPRISGKSGSDAAPEAAGERRPLSGPRSPAEQALGELRARIEREGDDVGRDFAREARAIHSGEAPDRLIYGQTRPEEARALIEEGVPVSPRPFAPGRKAN